MKKKTNKRQEARKEERAAQKWIANARKSNQTINI